MIIISVWYTVKPGLRDKVMELAGPNVEGTRKEPGNIEYTHYPSMENDQDMFVYEVWESKEAVEAHTHAKHYLDFALARKPMLVEGSYRYIIYDAKEKVRGDGIASWR